jgi:hypothetical protein
MSLTRDRGYLIAECDECHETLETKCTGFDEAREELRNQEWLTWKEPRGSLEEFLQPVL